MREFFKGWRRKTGCVALMLACVVSCIWIRTTRYETEICCDLGGQRILIHADSGVVTWYWWKYRTVGGFDIRIRIADRTDVEYLFSKLGFVIMSPIRLKLSCAQMVWPLTLLSAYLILWKPRKAPTTRPMPV
jgi:hypothetical protein